MSHLFYGVHEQSYVAHVVGHAACMGPYASPASDLARCQGGQSHGATISPSLTTSLLILLLVPLINGLNEL